MNAKRAWKFFLALRAAGPYLLIELVLPGGTLVAFLLWLSQRFKRGGFSEMRGFLAFRRPAKVILEAKPHDLPASPIGPFSAAAR